MLRLSYMSWLIKIPSRTNHNLAPANRMTAEETHEQCQYCRGLDRVIPGAQARSETPNLRRPDDIGGRLKVLGSHCLGTE